VNRAVTDELYHYGVADADHTILKSAEISGRVPRGSNAPSFVSTLDPHRITLFKVKVGIPLFALYGINEMERAYKDPAKTVSNHLHKDWDQFPDVIPRSGDGRALRWFAIAQAPPPFGQIRSDSGWYYVTSQLAKRTDNGELRLAQGRLNAYRAFEKNPTLVKEIEERVNLIARAEGQAKVADVLREHVDHLVRQVSEGHVDPSIKEQIESEIQAVDDYLLQLSTIQ
jgi:predicted DNA-binding protein